MLKIKLIHILTMLMFIFSTGICILIPMIGISEKGIFGLLIGIPISVILWIISIFYIIITLAAQDE